jgi:hypothetical protein
VSSPLNTPAAAPAGTAVVDHLVVTADTLEDGVRWCEATLGVSPGPGGKHPLMGTHNRLLKIATAGFPEAYLEIIAIDPDASAPARRRWFGMDERAPGTPPRLVHWVARTDDVAARRQALLALGLDPGTPVAASRPSPGGLLQWQITVRDDGRMLCGGACPTLIEWQGVHPTTAMPDSGLALVSLQLSGLPAGVPGSIAFAPVTAVAQGPALRAILRTPRGEVALTSPDALDD